MESRFCTYKRVGYLRQKIANELGIEFTGVIYASPGVLKHIIRRHGKQLENKSKGSLVDSMRLILEKPDYVGIYKTKKGQTAVEFVKNFGTNLLIGIELDEINQYIYVSTMYPISQGKINNKLNSGKLVQTETLYNYY